jgi:hypothetical protein
MTTHDVRSALTTLAAVTASVHATTCAAALAAAASCTSPLVVVVVIVVLTALVVRDARRSARLVARLSATIRYVVALGYRPLTSTAALPRMPRARHERTLVVATTIVVAAATVACVPYATMAALAAGVARLSVDTYTRRLTRRLVAGARPDDVAYVSALDSDDSDDDDAPTTTLLDDDDIPARFERECATRVKMQ